MPRGRQRGVKVTVFDTVFIWAMVETLRSPFSPILMFVWSREGAGRWRGKPESDHTARTNRWNGLYERKPADMRVRGRRGGVCDWALLSLGILDFPDRERVVVTSLTSAGWP